MLMKVVYCILNCGRRIDGFCDPDKGRTMWFREGYNLLEVNKVKELPLNAIRCSGYYYGGNEK